MSQQCNLNNIFHESKGHFLCLLKTWGGLAPGSYVPVRIAISPLRCVAVPVFGNVPRSALAYRKGKKQPRLDEGPEEVKWELGLINF
jgi:hypothetical protein